MVTFDLNNLVNSMINGLFVGMGSGLGLWIVTRHLIRNIEKVEEKLLRNGNGKSEAKKIA
jgi:hypothetical protein